MKNILLSVFILSGFFAPAQVLITDSFDKLVLAPYCDVFSGSRNQYTIYDLIHKDTSVFSSNGSRVLMFTEDDYKEDLWVRIKLVNIAHDAKKVLLELNNPMIGEVVCFVVREGKIIQYHLLGDEFIYHAREIDYRTPLFVIDIDSGTHLQVYLKVFTGGRKIHLPLSLKSPSRFIADSQKQSLLLGFFYGILFCIAILYTYLFYILKDKVFIRFSLYIFALLLTQVSLSGIAFAYLWPDYPYWANRSIAFSISLALFLGIRFLFQFITKPKLLFYSTFILRAFQVITLSTAIMALLNEYWFNIAVHILYFAIPLAYILFLVAGLIVLLKKFVSARFFVSGFIAAMFSMFAMLYAALNIEEENIFTNNMVIFAIMLKCILLSMALLDRLKIFKEEKEKAQAQAIEQLKSINDYKEELNLELENKVNAKSKELLDKQYEVKKALIWGEEKERKRVARELHDGMGSLLSTLRLNAESIDLADKGLSPKEMTAYNNVMEMIDKACGELRNISHNMLPAGIEHFGLVATLKDVLKKFNQTGNVEFTLDVLNFEKVLNKEIELCVYRILMELINNIIKHAEAKFATVHLSQDENILLLIVEDDGKGFDANKKVNGIGMISIKSRLDALNGLFKIDSTFDRGTTILIEIPLS